MTQAALGGTFYFVLIILTQVAGISVEILLIRRVRSVLPTREKIILGPLSSVPLLETKGPYACRLVVLTLAVATASALSIEILRMLVINIFVLEQYFYSDAYHIYRAPSLGSCSSVGLSNTTDSEWIGADGTEFCTEHAPPAIVNGTLLNPQLSRPADTTYYIANHRTDYTLDRNRCSVFTHESALLDFDETSGTWGSGGHPRFSRLGWVIGGEFALYYFFATFINELADCMFVVPTTTREGWRCKIFSVALEVAQV
eukprot:SAG31_NODE_2702_length_5221_cov_1.495705_6_plen_257_part_00